MFSESYLQDLRMLKMVHPNGNALLNLFKLECFAYSTKLSRRKFQITALISSLHSYNRTRRDKLCIRLYFKRLADV